MMGILSGCNLSEPTLVAAILKGQTEAGVALPEWPDECRKNEIHAALKKGEDIRSILKRERRALERANSRTNACATFYDELRAALAGGPK